MKDALDCALVCEGGVEFVINEDGDERIADLGRPVLAGAGEADVFLAKGLLRRCAVPLALKAMLRCQHSQVLALWLWFESQLNST